MIKLRCRLATALVVINELLPFLLNINTIRPLKMAAFNPVHAAQFPRLGKI